MQDRLLPGPAAPDAAGIAVTKTLVFGTLLSMLQAALDDVGILLQMLLSSNVISPPMVNMHSPLMAPVLLQVWAVMHPGHAGNSCRHPISGTPLP